MKMFLYTFYITNTKELNTHMLSLAAETLQDAYNILDTIIDKDAEKVADVTYKELTVA